MNDDHRYTQMLYGMARGEGARADAVTLRGGRGPRALVVGTLIVLALVALVYWFALRGGVTRAVATGVEVDLAANEVVVTFDPPDGCWAATDDSSAEIVGGELVLDLRIQPRQDGCRSDAVLPLSVLPGSGPDADNPDTLPVRQIACDRYSANECSEQVTATVVG